MLPEDLAQAQAFLADVPAPDGPIVRFKPFTRQELATKLSIGRDDRFKPITKLAGTTAYHASCVRETAQNVYFLIDDVTPDTGPDAAIDPTLAEAYRALMRASQLLFEAETHLYRFVNKIETAEAASE